jgi:hypothetical protein
MQMASWAVLRLRLSKQAAGTRPPVVLLVQQPPIVRLKRWEEACEEGNETRSYVLEEEGGSDLAIGPKRALPSH